MTPLISLGSTLLAVLAFLINSNAATGSVVVECILLAGLLQMPMLVIPLFVSNRVSILKHIVASASLKHIVDYLGNIPIGWMITQKRPFNLNTVFSAAGLLTGLAALLTYWVESQRQVLSDPWDNTYRDFGSCYDGIRSGFEQHIDCGGPESSCPQTCREKYGDYIIISASRECTDVEGYVHITTQRACSIGYEAWARLHNKTRTNHAVMMEGVLRDGISGFETTEWFHADWTNGFRCGAVTRPGWAELTTTLKTSPFTSFPAVFSPWNPSFGTQKPIAYLCYAERSQSCEALTRMRRDVQFKEAMGCPNTVRYKWYGSAWRNISGTRPIPATKSSAGSIVVGFRATSGSDGDCAKIQLHGAVHGIGAQVVFALKCDVTKNVTVTAGAKAGASSGNERPLNACPENNRVQVSVKSATVPRATLLVYPAARGASMASYSLEVKEQTAIVRPDSTLILVADKSSYSMNVSVCF